MKKLKWLFGLCLMVLVVCGSGGSVNATDVVMDSVDDGSETDVSDFRWSENEDGTLTITKYVGTDETVVIPSEIEGKSVKSIDLDPINHGGNTQKIKYLSISEGIINIISNSFNQCKKLESVFLPSTLQTIGDDAFNDCNNLKEVKLPEGLTMIGDNAFRNCVKLENINFPNSLINIGRFVFSNCYSISKITIPGNLKVIEVAAFQNCLNLQETEIKDGVTKIDGSSFMYCGKLQKIIIPDSVKNIAYTAFISELAIDPIFPDNFTIYANPNSYARTYANQYGIKFSCLNTHDWDKGIITTQPTAIENGIKTFTCTACKTTKTEKVTKLGLPRKGKSITETKSNNTYKVIKSSAKNGTVEFAKVSKSSSSITIPNTVTVDGVIYKVTSVSKNAFKNNKKLKRVTIGKNITKINTNTFYGCKNLKTITIKSTNIESVGKNAFKGINAKAKIKVPKNKLKSYKKMFAKKGQKSTVKIVK